MTREGEESLEGKREYLYPLYLFPKKKKSPMSFFQEGKDWSFGKERREGPWSSLP